MTDFDRDNLARGDRAHWAAPHWILPDFRTHLEVRIVGPHGPGYTVATVTGRRHWALRGDLHDPQRPVPWPAGWPMPGSTATWPGTPALRAVAPGPWQVTVAKVISDRHAEVECADGTRFTADPQTFTDAGRPRPVPAPAPAAEVPALPYPWGDEEVLGLVFGDDWPVLLDPYADDYDGLRPY